MHLHTCTHTTHTRFSLNLSSLSFPPYHLSPITPLFLLIFLLSLSLSWLFLCPLFLTPFVSLLFDPTLSAIAIGKSGCVPYNEIESGRLSVTITGISKPVRFQQPKTYRVTQLQYLLDAKENFKLSGMYSSMSSF